MQLVTFCKVHTLKLYTYFLYTKAMKQTERTQCSPVKTTINVIGGKWKPVILFQLCNNTLRFSQLQKSIAGITQKMLTQQLREMEADDLIKRKVYPEVPPRVEYSITSFGKTLMPIFELMHDWGTKYQNHLQAQK